MANNSDTLVQDRMGTVPIGQPLDPKDHPAANMPAPTEDYWGDKPASQRPAKSQKSNVPDADSHPNDPWNKAFQ